MQVVSNTIRVPKYLLIPLEHPVSYSHPYTVEDLIIIISEYESVVEKANDRFIEINYIQDGTSPSN